MGNSENTAINELIARVSGGPTEPVGSPAQEAQGSGQHPQVPQLPTSYPVVSRAMLGAVTPLVPDPVAPAAAPVVDPSWGTPSGGHAWPPLDEPVITRVDQRRVGTVMIRRPPSELRVVIGKLIVPVALLVIAGVGIGGYVAFRAPGEPHAPEVRAAAAAQPPAKRAAELPPPPVSAVAVPAVAVPAPADRATPQPPPIADTAGQPVQAPSTAAAQPVPPAAATATQPVQTPSTAAAQPVPPAAATATQPVPPPAAAAIQPVQPAATVEQAGAPTITPLAEPPATLPALVDVRIDSVPSGATVTLIDRGRSQFVGTTPVNVAVDPSREYELMLSHPGKPSQVVRLDARATRRVAVTLGRRARSLDGAARPERAAPASSPATPATPATPDEPSTGKAIDDAK